jgi:hypothetical protein
MAEHLKRSQVPKERYLNRSEWMAHRYKNETVDTYEWVPEIMTDIVPGPKYHNPGHVKQGGIRANKMKRAAEGLDAFRNPIINMK